MGKRLWTCAVVGSLVLPACEGSSPPVPTTIVITPSTFTFTTLGQTQQFMAELRDENGNAMTGTFTFNWNTNNSGSVTIDASGLATAARDGSATITANTEGVSGQATVTVDQAPDDLQKAAGDGQTGASGTLLGQPIQVLLLDAGGSPIPGKAVSFSVVGGGGSVSPDQATTNSSGVATTGWTMGQAGVPQTLRASIAGLTTDFTATAEVGALAVKTTTLADGRLTMAYSGKIEGQGGDGTYTFSIESGNLPAGIAMQTDGDLTGTPSAEGTATFTVRVTDGAGDMASRVMTLRVCGAPLSFVLGQIIEVANQHLGGCRFFLQSGGDGDTYRIAVVRPSASEEATTVSTSLSMNALGVQPAPAAGVPLRALRASAEPALELSPWLAQDIRLAESTERAHVRIREAEMELVARLRTEYGPPIPGPVQARAALEGRAVPPATQTLKVAQDFGSCQSGKSNPATLRSFDDRLAVYQTTSEIGTSEEVPDAIVTQLLNYYRDYGKEVIDKYFGGVPDVNGDGMMTVLITPDIDEGTAAFVWSGDYYQNTPGGQGLSGVCQDSNVQEVIYFRTEFVNSMTPPPGGNPSYQALSTLVHEAKHVSSLYNRVTSTFTPSPFHPSWIEEGTSEIAGEMSSRLAWAATGGPAVGSEVTRQDFADSFGGGQPISPEAYGVFLRMARAVYYASSQPNGISASPSAQQGGIYGSGLTFHRFLGDAYGGAFGNPLGDQSLFNTQNNVNTPPGTSGMTQITGRTYLQLLDEFAKAVMMEGTGFEPPQSFKTYDMTSATEIFSLPDPAGIWPWPVTKTCNGGPCPTGVDSRDPNPDNDDGYVPGAPFQDRTYSGQLGPGGIRIHEFVSNGTGTGAEVSVTGSSGLKVFVARIN